MLNIDGYFESLLAMFDRGKKDAFIEAQHRRIVLEDDDPERLISRLLPPA